MEGHGRPQIAAPPTYRKGEEMDIADYSEQREPQRRTLEEVGADIDALNAQIDELNRRKSQLVVEHDEIAAAANPIPSIF